VRRTPLLVGIAAAVVALLPAWGAPGVGGDELGAWDGRNSHPGARGGRSNSERQTLRKAGSGVKLNPVGKFNTPVYVTSAPGYPELVFVVEQAGRVKVLRDGRKRGTFLDITGLVMSNYEEGMFSLAFHPRYERNRLFYVFYVDNNGNLRVDEFKRRSALRAARRSRRPVMRIRHQPLNTHNADQLQFLGRLLYISIGDGGGPGDPGDDAKNKRSLLGKILRINPRNPKGRADYSVPRSNPFVGRRGHNEIFSYGLRNPWRFSFDTVSAAKPRIVIADVGQEGFEEVDYEKVGGARGTFFGWDEYEGFKAFECDGRCARNAEPPIYTYGRSRGCTIIGGYVVRDPRLGSLYGRYLFTDLCRGKIKALRPRLRRVRHASRTGLRVNTPVSFGEDSQGRVYVTSLLGPVYRIDPAG
jgi:glucose/arabinose dehydrogenase